jgi:phospholipid transport system substrate-binding protein
MNRVFFALALVLLASLSFATATPSAADSPNSVVEDAVALLSKGLDDRRDELKKDPQALYDFINGILLPRFERRVAAIAVLGPYWRQATEEQRNRFIDAFYTTLVHRYAEGILDFNTDRIKILPFRGDPSRPITTVRTQVQLEDGTEAQVDYDLVKSKDDGKWRMFNVNIEGVSYVKNFRTEFDQEIRASSLEDVIERLEREATSTDEDGKGGGVLHKDSGSAAQSQSDTQAKAADSE